MLKVSCLSQLVPDPDRADPWRIIAIGIVRLSLCIWLFAMSGTENRMSRTPYRVRSVIMQFAI